MATAKAHARDPIIIGGRSYSDKDAFDVLATRLKSASRRCLRVSQCDAGAVSGLAVWPVPVAVGSPEVFVEGVITRMTPLSRDHHGPRAILNAVERIIDAYDAECDRARHDLTIAQTPVTGLRGPPRYGVSP